MIRYLESDWLVFRDADREPKANQKGQIQLKILGLTRVLAFAIDNTATVTAFG